MCQEKDPLVYWRI